MVEACIKIALGIRPDFTPTMSYGSAIRYFHQSPGVIKSIRGIDESEQMNGIKHISIVHGVGEKITDIIDSGSRMGFVIAQGKDADDASRICEEALSRIRIEESEYAD